jgi:hypothetical protein
MMRGNDKQATSKQMMDYDFINFQDDQRVKVYNSMRPVPHHFPNMERRAFLASLTGAPIETVKVANTLKSTNEEGDTDYTNWIASKPYVEPASEQAFVGECSQYLEFKLDTKLPLDVSQWDYVHPADYKVW